MSSNILQGVVAFIQCSDAVHNAKAAIHDRLKKNGAKVITRITKEVSHVIFERKRYHSAGTKANEDTKVLVTLYKKFKGMPHPPCVVGPLWVEESIAQNRRLIETKFIIALPKEDIIENYGSSGASDGKTKRRRHPSVVPAPPKPAQTYDLEPYDWVFSSTQQLNEGEAPEQQDEPRGRRRGQRRRNQAKARGRQSAVACARTGDGDGHEEDGLFVPGSETQAVADILASDLPWEDHVAGGMEEERKDDVGDDDDLDTPLALRLVRHSSEKKATKEGSLPRNNDSSSQDHKPVGRSRLAQASGPQSRADATLPMLRGAHVQEDEEEGREEADIIQCTQEGAADLHTAGKKTFDPGSRALVSGVSQRFSIRQLQRHPSRPVKVHKGTPLTNEPQSIGRQKRSKGPIPIPLVQRVDSPWNVPDKVSPESLGRRDSEGRAVRKLRSLGIPHHRCSSDGSRGVATPRTHRFKSINARTSLPSPWSVPRAWDDNPAAKQAKQQPLVALSVPNSAEENLDGPAEGDSESKEGRFAEYSGTMVQYNNADDHGQDEGEQDDDVTERNENAERMLIHAEREQRQPRRAPAGRKRRLPLTPSGIPHAEKRRRGRVGEEGNGGGSLQGYLAVTNVSASVAELCRSAARRLRGFRLCASDRQEDRDMTHLVIGKDRRTIKALLAVANGAEMVSPEWVTASLEAGRWLPTDGFAARGRFRLAAERARSSVKGPEPRKLLAGYAICFYTDRKARSASTGTALRRLATALGARQGTLSSCTVCVAGDETSRRPPGLGKDSPYVSEEWLLHAAEHYTIPATGQFLME